MDKFLRVQPDADKVNPRQFVESQSRIEIAISKIISVILGFVDSSGKIHHNTLEDMNTSAYTHLTSTQATDLTDSGATTLHKHDHSTQDNLNSSSYTHLTATQATDLTDSGATTLHKHDHGGQDGLTDDDHSGYAWLVGRSGGQTLKGDTASGGNLTLMSTAHATKGKILFGSSGYSEVDDRIGVGTSSPSACVQATKTHNSGTTLEQFRFSYDSNWGLYLVQNYVGAGDIKYELKQVYSGTTYNVLSFKSGNVGVGTASPATKVHVLDTSSTTPILTVQGQYVGGGGSGKSGVQLDVNGNGGFAILNDASSGTRTLTINSNDGWGGSTAERVRITSGGSVGIGTSPSYQLHISTNSAGKPGGGSWSDSSDIRLKEEITVADYSLCLNNIRNLELKRWKWKDDIDQTFSPKNMPDRHMLGWVAQDIEQIMPKSVDIKNTFGISDCRWKNNDQIYAMTYGALKAVINIVDNQESLIAAQKSRIDEQQSRIDAQQTQIEKLIADVAALKGSQDGST